MENQEKQHKRRVRYKGTHPRSYKEKYKELNPEKYPETVEKVIGKGGTPAGMHISICVKENVMIFQKLSLYISTFRTSLSVLFDLHI